jgi:UDP-glucose 4-epimerase
MLTGGTGFIGSHSSVVLQEHGHEVLLLDNLSNSKKSVVERIGKITDTVPEFAKADIRDFNAISHIIGGFAPDAVIHFAGLKAVGESVEKPLEYYHNNITGTLVLLDAMRGCGVKKLIFSSSATVYRADNPVPYFENFPLGATNPYGWTKVMIEQILRDVCAADEEWSVALLRYFNPIGAHPSGLIGEDPNGIPNNLVPYVAKVASGELEKIHVFGNDYDTKDGTGVRDYIHVMDVARGHLSALEYLEGRTGSFAFNLGTGIGYSVLDVIAAYEKACGKKLPYTFDPRRAGDLASVYANADLAKKELSFKTNYGIEEMCQDSWTWTKTAQKRYLKHLKAKDRFDEK